MEVVRANIVSDVEVELRVGNLSESEASESEAAESEAAESDDDLTCGICSSNDGEVTHYNLVDGRVVCAPCNVADDTLAAVDSFF